jgi:predicted ATPase
MAQFFHELRFNPPVDTFLPKDPHGVLKILTGLNNSGKSAYLKTTVDDPKRLYIGVNRFYSFHHVPLYTKNENEVTDWYNQTQHQARFQPFHNFENSFFNCQTAIARLRNDRRALLFDVFRELFGVPIKVEPEDPENEFSNRYVSVDGDSLSVTSSGTRLFLGILAALMDDRFSSVAIDEPELGLSPSLQRRLAEIVVGGQRKEELFPHNPNIMLSTHSHIFLDKLHPGNNFIVSRSGNEIFARPVEDFQELHEVQFRLLGNDLSELFLPDGVIFVEGETDKIYLDKLITIHFPNSKVVVQDCGGDIAKRLNYWSTTLGDIQISPYRHRTFVVVDSVKQTGLERVCKNIGLPSESLVEWKGNGIEFVYPTELLTKIFRTQVNSTDELEIDGDFVRKDQITYKKMDLCKKICADTTAQTPVHQEMQDKLFSALRKLLTRPM